MIIAECFALREKCDVLFRRVITDFGFCFTLNMLEYHEIFNFEMEDFESYWRGDDEDYLVERDGEVYKRSNVVYDGELELIKFDPFPNFFPHLLNR